MEHNLILTHRNIDFLCQKRAEKKQVSTHSYVLMQVKRLYSQYKTMFLCVEVISPNLQF